MSITTSDGFIFNNISSKEYAFGIVAGIMIMKLDLIISYNNIHIDQNNWRKYLTNHILGHDIVDNIKKYIPEPNKYVWYVRDISDSKQFVYYIFTFGDNEFLNGFIDSFEAYNKDFRYYILGPPFQYDYATNKVIKFNIDGYDIEDFDGFVQIPSSIYPFYTQTIENDPYAVDFV